jgi:pimeloyl-ACP methyl ester carboxylesterase/DNA-binding CsgD family transcriptional regulator
MEGPTVQYVQTRDGVKLAYAIAGQGDAVVNLPFHFNHVTRRWIPLWFRGVAEHFRVVHYDSRGQGLSSRGLPQELTVQDYRTDLETIIETVGFERFALMAYGGFGHVAARYAAENPERVTALILICSSDSFEAWSPAAHLGMAAENWDLFLDLQTGKFTPEIAQLIKAFMKESTSQADYLQMIRAFIRGPSIAGVLPALRMPALLLHSLDQHWLPPAEGAKVAARMPNAKILFTDGDVEPDERQAVPAIIDFLKGVYSSDSIGPQPRGTVTSREPLTPRQNEVLRLISHGRTTREIAGELVLSDRTVERHIADVYAKIGARNRSEATAYFLSRVLVHEPALAESTQSSR